MKKGILKRLCIACLTTLVATVSFIIGVMKAMIMEKRVEMIAKFYTDNDAKPTLIGCEKCKNMYEHEVTYETQKQRWFGAISINITDWYLKHVYCRVTYWNNYYKYDCEEVDIKERSEYLEFTFPKNHFTLLQAITYMKKYFYMHNHEYANRDWEVIYTSSEEDF